MLNSTFEIKYVRIYTAMLTADNHCKLVCELFQCAVFMEIFDLFFAGFGDNLFHVGKHPIPTTT